MSVFLMWSIFFRSCSKHEQVFLRAIVACFQKSGLEETSFDRVFDVAREIAAVEDGSASAGAALHSSAAFKICFDLAASRKVYTSNSDAQSNELQ